jgi:hypothetical protein
MTHRSHRGVRSATRGARAWLCVYLLGLLLAPLADAGLEAQASGGRQHHIESADAPTCPPVHDHSVCQVCRTVRTVAAPAGALRLPLALAAVVAPTIAHCSVALPASLTYPLGPRAPPHA